MDIILTARVIANVGAEQMRTLLAAALIAIAQTASAQAILWPDPTLTPGAVRSTDTRTLRHGGRERSDLTYERYGVAPADGMQYTLDHLIPLAIGGADDDANLWPEPRRSIESEWNAERKDDLEWRLRDLVCSGALDVHEAQRMIAADWPEAYREVVRER
jgi:hypothetical protein